MTKKRTPATKPKGHTTTHAKSEAAMFRIVGMGASAGGLEAFTAFLNAMPPDSGMAFVLVHHLDPEHESMMAELLARHTEMRVLPAQDNMVVVPDHVFVIPPNRYMEIENGILRLSQPRDRRGTRLPINRFLMSLARDQGQIAVAVILSGTGSDGSAAIAEIKALGGIVLVQDPEEAQQEGMPRRAIATGAADQVAPIAQMPSLLYQFASQAVAASTAFKTPLGGKARDSLAAIIATLKAYTPINFEFYKEGTLLRRIERRMVLRHMQNTVDYNALLMDSPEEAERLCRDLLISVTSFFRDPEAYAYLEKNELPELIRSHNPGQMVRVWVLACATGEEAYSLAMLLIERISALKMDIKIQIFASDVDEDALATARTGIYPDSIEADVSQQRLDRFFVKHDHSYRVTRELRDTVIFANQNVLSDAPFSKMDLISCRNLLIYLTPEAQDRVIETIHFALRDGGVLFLGVSETVGANEMMFQPRSKKHRVFNRSGPSRTRHLPLAAVPGSHIRSGEAPMRTDPELDRLRLAELSQRLLVERYAPAAVLVNANADTLYLEGQTDQYIKVPTGEVSRDLLTMARDGLRARLSSVLHTARETGAEASSTATLMRGGRSVNVQMHAHPVAMNGSKLFLVTFQDQAVPPQEIAGTAQKGPANHLLEKELEETRADLRNTIREYERITEGLKVTNEQALSMNEEFQSTNEELETSKEELQSLNEELTTLNTQLQQKIEAERRLSDDLNNLLASSGVATIFLNRDREIMRFTPTSRDLFNLISKDVGRPISDITSSINDPTLFEDISKVQQTHAPRQIEVRAKDGKGYIRRILPYRTQDEKNGGVVITFSDVSALQEMQRKTLAAQQIAKNIVNTVRDPLLVLNGDLKVVSASMPFQRLFGTADDPVVGKSLFALSDGQWDIPELRRHLGLVLPEKRPIEAFSLSIRVAGKGERDLVLNARKLANEHAVDDLILLAMDDVTEQKAARQSLRDREARLSAILNAVPEAIITINTKGIVTSYSPPSAEILGYIQSDVLGHNVNLLMPEPHRQHHDDYVAAYLSSGQAKIIGTGRELEARHRSGATVPIHLQVSELIIGGERQFLGVIRDLTKEMESRKQLEQARKMEAVGQLTGGIAHDFNNLLTVVIGNIELLEMRPDDPNRDDILGEALEAANLGAVLVGKLLSFSKRQTLAPEKLELTRLVEVLKPLLQRTLGAQIVIGAELDENLDLVMADPGQIENAVLNMAINARDAMPQGGALTIRAQNVNVDADHTPDKTDLAPGDYVALSVSDTGSGMAPDVMDRAFEPFFSTKEPGKGTGLGLAMVFGLAKQSGGDVALHSELGRGTVVTLYLPAIEQEVTTPGAARAFAATDSEAGGETILLVEDDLRVRNLTRHRLEHLGYSVVEAEDGPDALKRLEENDDIRLMLSDIVMPGGMNGYELADKAHGLYPDLGIILATGFSPNDSNVTAGGGDAAYPVLRKPYKMQTLSDALRRLLDWPSS